MITLIVLILIYILSGIRVYTWTQKAHFHPKGNYYGVKTGQADVFFTFVPIFNTVAALMCLGTWKDDKYINTDNSIFKPRKPFK